VKLSKTHTKPQRSNLGGFAPLREKITGIPEEPQQQMPLSNLTDNE